LEKLLCTASVPSFLVTLATDYSGQAPFNDMQVCRVYIGSFNANVPIRTDLNPDGVKLFEKEQADLLQDLYEIPQRSCDRRVSPLF
jgi:hypothetical protein